MVNGNKKDPKMELLDCRHILGHMNCGDMRWNLADMVTTCEELGFQAVCRISGIALAQML